MKRQQKRKNHADVTIETVFILVVVFSAILLLAYMGKMGGVV